MGPVAATLLALAGLLVIVLGLREALRILRRRNDDDNEDEGQT